MNKNEIYINYGNNPKQMVKELLNLTRIENEIDKNFSICLKPNLVNAKKAISGSTTHPEIIEGIIEYLLDQNIKNIKIMEGSWIGCETRNAFKVCGYDLISKKYNVPLIDLKNDKTEIIKIDDMILTVCSSVKNINYFINVPVLKAHCQTMFTCALKNMKGCIPDNEKQQYHSLGLHKPIAYLNKILKQDLIIVDGICGDLTFEEGGTPVSMNRIMIAKDPVLIDSFGASLIGLKINDVPYIKKAFELGVGNISLENIIIKEIGSEEKKKNLYKANEKIKDFSKYIFEKNSCSSCYAALIHALHQLKERNLLNNDGNMFYIGQGFQGKPIDEFGVGDCTSKFKNHVKGCPPKAIDIIDCFLKNFKNNN